MKLQQYYLTEADLLHVDQLVTTIVANGYADSEEIFFLEVPQLIERLPDTIRELAQNLLKGECHAIKFSNLESTFQQLPPTPPNHESRHGSQLTRAEAFHGLVSSCLGAPFGYRSQQSGRVFNDIIPIEAHSSISNASSNSTKRFDLHTEDAFFEYPPQYIGWVAIRNNENLPLMIACIDDLQLVADDVALLSSAEFVLKANALQFVNDCHKKFSVLEPDDAGGHKMRFNGAIWKSVSDQKQLVDAYRHFGTRLDSYSYEITIGTGEALYVDNSKCAHGRAAFAPSSPQDRRWLSRVVVARDLGRLANYIFGSSDRIIDTELPNALT